MRWTICRITFLAMVIVIGVAGCAQAPALSKRAEKPAPLLIISLDAFRWDYCDLHPQQTPNLRRLRSEGASARALIPVFPSNTFPNHYTMVTGLWPAHHGIINNVMFDPPSGRFFRNTLATVRDSFWWGGEPIWVTAEKQGFRSACSFWVGSEAEIAGFRPNFWRIYDVTLPFETRLNELAGWFQLPPEQRPQVVAFYLEEANSVGHTFGPDSPELVATIQKLDTQVGQILDRLSALAVVPNLVVVSDHGMSNVIPSRCIALDGYIDLNAVQIDFAGPAAGLRPLNGTVDALVEKLKALPPGAKVYRLEELPARFHLKDNPRLPPVWVLPEEGGSIGTKDALAAWEKKTRGEHGYDPQLANMQATLIVHGPAFRTDGAVIAPVENIHLYNLFCAVLHLKPAPNDGDDRLVRSLLNR